MGVVGLILSLVLLLLLLVVVVVVVLRWGIKRKWGWGRGEESMYHFGNHRHPNRLDEHGCRLRVANKLILYPQNLSHPIDFRALK